MCGDDETACTAARHAHGALFLATAKRQTAFYCMSTAAEHNDVDIMRHLHIYLNGRCFHVTAARCGSLTGTSYRFLHH